MGLSYDAARSWMASTQGCTKKCFLYLVILDKTLSRGCKSNEDGKRKVGEGLTHLSPAVNGPTPITTQNTRQSLTNTACSSSAPVYKTLPQDF